MIWGTRELDIKSFTRWLLWKWS